MASGNLNGLLNHKPDADGKVNESREAASPAAGPRLLRLSLPLGKPALLKQGPAFGSEFRKTRESQIQGPPPHARQNTGDTVFSVVAKPTGLFALDGRVPDVVSLKNF